MLREGSPGLTGSYVLIGHNICWELVKIRTFDLMGTSAHDTMQFLSPVYLRFIGKSI